MKYFADECMSKRKSSNGMKQLRQAISINRPPFRPMTIVYAGAKYMLVQNRWQ